MFSSHLIGLGIYPPANALVNMDASRIVSADHDIVMHDSEAVTNDDDPTEALDNIKTLDSHGEFVFMRCKPATESEQAYAIHYAVLKHVKGFAYARKFHSDRRYLETQPSFIRAILTAYENRDFRTILSWCPNQELTPYSSSKDGLLPGNAQSWYYIQSPPVALTDICAFTAIARQYYMPYKGQVAQKFATFVQTLAQRFPHYKRPLYANVIPVIQSSGTGKSRMLTETGKILFTLPFCAREERGTGWPPGDNNILAFLLESRNNQFEINTHITFITFLSAIFIEMKRVFETFGTSDINTLRRHWYRYMEPEDLSPILTRNDFYENVLRGTKDNEFMMRSWNSKLKPEVKYSEKPNPEFFDLLINRVNDISRKFLKPRVEAFLNIIPQEVLLVYMDEVHTFGGRYWALQRVLSTLKEHRQLWFSFMGTNVSLSEFVPAASSIKSLRSAEEMMVLLPPYTALGFDQNITDIDQSSHQKVTMEQVCSLDWVCNFGRPFWKAMWEASRIVSAGGVVDEIAFFRTVQTKLLCSANEFNRKKPEQVFAVLAYTVCLDLVLGNRAATKLANDSVAKHMRLLIDINDDRTMYFTQTSSEPVLALVGAFIAANPESKNLSDIIDGLKDNLYNDGLVDKSRHDELLTRMILFIARIQTCIQTCSPPLTPLSFAIPVPVVHFFKTLFGDLWNEAHGHERFEEGLKGGYLNFYHFTLTLDTMLVNEDFRNLEANLWARGTALQCRDFRQADIDGHIPVYWGPISNGAVLDPSHFSSLNYQVKFRHEGDTVSADRIQRPACDRGNVKRSSHPFITVFLDMGSEENYKTTKSRLWLETGAETLQRLKMLDIAGLSSKMQKAVKKAIETLELDANRYCIRARGCDERIFGVLKTMGIATNWKKLVEITEEVPKADGDVMKTMLPLHRLNPASGYCDWMIDYSL